MPLIKLEVVYANNKGNNKPKSVIRSCVDIISNGRFEFINDFPRENLAV